MGNFAEDLDDDDQPFRLLRRNVERPAVRRRFAEVEKTDGTIVKIQDAIEIKVKSNLLEVIHGDEDFGADIVGFAPGTWKSYRLRNIEADASNRAASKRA